MKKRIKSAVISIVVIAVLLLSILIGVKNGTIDKLTKEMPTLETKHEQTDIQNENQNNTGNDSAREENLSKRDVAYIGQQFELRDDDIRYKYDENNRKTYNVFYISVRTVNISRECNFDVNRIRFGLDDKKDSIDADYNFISDYYYAMIELEVTKDINDNDIINAISLVGLNPYDKKEVKKYSLGMKQKLGIAQAIMESPKILILDEPMNGLDHESINQIRKLLL